MRTFAEEILDEVKSGKLIFYKLIINGKCLYDEFCKDNESNSNTLDSLMSIYATIDEMAEKDCMLPKSKFNSIKQKGKVIGYEFKKDKLRVYVIKKEPHIYVVLGGYKANQKKDIEKFGKIANDFTKQFKESNL